MSLNHFNTRVDVTRFVDWTPYGPRQHFFSISGVGARGGEIGEGLGVLALRHSPGYEIIVRFADGRCDSFAPHSLFPAQVSDEDLDAFPAETLPLPWE